MRKFILADNQDITRMGLEAVIGENGLAGEIRTCRDVRSLGTALAAWPDAAVILDYTLFDFYGVEQLLNLCSRYDRTSWLIFSDELGRSFIRTGCGRGHLNIVMKTDPVQCIAEALRATAGYRSYYCEFALRILQEESAAGETEHLTPSETSILREISLGKTTKEIAAGRCLSFHTVNSHRKNIFRKLGVNNLQEAIRYALRAGIIDMADYNI